MRKKFFVSTPIYYVNDRPHIGHLCSTLAADILARYHRLLGDEVFFLTGTDEHGAKIAEAAQKHKQTPKEYCDQLATDFKQDWQNLNLSYDFFIRTTDPRHEKIVSEFTQKIYDKGDIYKGIYEGLYCIGCEKFLTEADLVDDHCPLHPDRLPVKQKEKNYFFKLSKYQKQIEETLGDNRSKNYYAIYPENKKQEIINKVKRGLEDISISRASVSWGIPLPWDRSQTIYVWFDALLNYYTATRFLKGKEKFWPADLHIVGKEISWFHAVIWSAMLLSVDLALPKKLLVHSFYISSRQKMSKSIGNIIIPKQLLDNFGLEGTRYLIALTFPVSHDSDISLDYLKEKYNANLANGIGNLVSRVLTLAIKYCDGKVPAIEKDPEQHPLRVSKKIYTWKDAYRDRDKALEKYKFNEALEAIWKFIGTADKYVNDTKPWELALKDKEKFNFVIYGLLDSIHQLAWMIYPFLPGTSFRIAQALQIKGLLTSKPNDKDSWTNIKSGTKINNVKPLFPRLK